VLGRIYSVHCDVCWRQDWRLLGCHAWVAQADDSATARREARRQGWKRVDPGPLGLPYGLHNGLLDACPTALAEIARRAGAEPATA